MAAIPQIQPQYTVYNPDLDLTDQIKESGPTTCIPVMLEHINIPFWVKTVEFLPLHVNDKILHLTLTITAAIYINHTHNSATYDEWKVNVTCSNDSNIHLNAISLKKIDAEIKKIYDASSKKT